MTTAWTNCIVHDWKYFPKFYGNINEIHHTKQFNVFILQELRKRCCSCHGQKGESLFDFDHLQKLCHEIESKIECEIVSIPYLVLEFPSKFGSVERTHKIAQFIGRGGKQIKVVQQQFNVYINIVNGKSNIEYQNIVNKLKQENKQYQENALWILINKKKKNYIDKNTINQIKKILEDRWNYPEKFIKINRSKTKKISKDKNRSEPLYFDKDTRWKPKKQRPRDMKQNKTKQFNLSSEIICKYFY